MIVWLCGYVAMWLPDAYLLYDVGLVERNACGVRLSAKVVSEHKEMNVALWLLAVDLRMIWE